MFNVIVISMLASGIAVIGLIADDMKKQKMGMH